MSRQRAGVRLNAAQLGILLGGGLTEASVYGIVHDPMRATFTVVVDSPDFEPVPDDSEAPIDTGLEMTLQAAVAHPVGELVTLLGTEVPADDLPAWLDGARDLVTYGSLRAVFDADAKVTADTHADLLTLAAYLVAIAGRTLTEDEAADFVAIDDALRHEDDDDA